jgi:Icc-related predicted phosphoesterase
MAVTIVAISDTHGLHQSLEIPKGDILVHAGDITKQGTLREVEEFNDFLGSLPHSEKIVIAGNHDFCCERDRQACEKALTNGVYLQDEGVTIQGIHFYGSPWQPWFYDWAFNLQRGPEIKAKWDLIPEDTDVLITHGPPLGRGDRTVLGQQVGCEDLLDTVERIRPRVHIFGHIHEAFGTSSNEHTTFINASSCNFGYEPVNPPVLYLYETSTG